MLSFRELELSDKVRRPAEAKKLSEVTHALEVWDTHVREFVEAGGRVPSFDEKKMGSWILKNSRDAKRKMWV